MFPKMGVALNHPFNQISGFSKATRIFWPFVGTWVPGYLPGGTSWGTFKGYLGCLLGHLQIPGRRCSKQKQLILSLEEIMDVEYLQQKQSWWGT